jgi:Methyltransferase FkbM domain
VKIPAITLRQIVNEYSFDRLTLICDIEGAEMDLIANEADLLRKQVSMLFIEIHSFRGTDVSKKVTDTLEKLGFDAIFHSEDDFCFRNRSLQAKGSDLYESPNHRRSRVHRFSFIRCADRQGR